MATADLHTPITRTLEIGRLDGGPCFAEITIRPTDKGPTLSICGTAPGMEGQCLDSFAEIRTFAPGWSPELRDRLIAVWRAWHLNGMQAGCEHQRAAGWQSCPGHSRANEWCRRPIGFPPVREIGEYVQGRRCHYDAVGMPCPVCGYRYGSAWLHEPLPTETITEIMSWPTGGVEAGPDGQAPSPYDLQAARWLARFGVRFSADHTQSKAGVGSAREHWTVTLRAEGVRPFVFDFWNSQHDTAKGLPLRASLVLSCLASDRGCTDADDTAAELGLAPREARKTAAMAARINQWLAQVEARTPGATEALDQMQ